MGNSRKFITVYNQCVEKTNCFEIFAATVFSDCIVPKLNLRKNFLMSFITKKTSNKKQNLICFKKLFCKQKDFQSYVKHKKAKAPSKEET